MDTLVDYTRPKFLDTLSELYHEREKRVVALTGDVQDIFWNRDTRSFLTLNQTISRTFERGFNVVFVSASKGLSFADQKSEDEVRAVCQAYDALPMVKKLGDVDASIKSTRQDSLNALIVISKISEAYSAIRADEQNAAKYKPLCVVISAADALLPAGELGKLPEVDRMRVVTFLEWIGDPLFAEKSGGLVLLVSDTRAALHGDIFKVPQAASIEIQLPNETERQILIDEQSKKSPVTFERDAATFARQSQGLTLWAIRDLLAVSSKSGKAVTQASVIDAINEVLRVALDGIVTIRIPGHGPDDIIGYAEHRRVLDWVFELSNDPTKALSGILASGSNGVGKTHIFEAYALKSGRIVVELTGLRSKMFGETDQFFEKFRFYITVFGNVLILIDEADLAFGSTEGDDSHETEKRLTGNLVKLMGDPKYFGKLIWVLMTARPQQLPADIKSRCPAKVPIFDLEGEERAVFVKELFRRNKVELSDGQLKIVISKTEHYSNRDYRDLARLGSGFADGIEKLLEFWGASTDIEDDRKLQALIAAQHCSFPILLPETYKKLGASGIKVAISELRLEKTLKKVA